MTCRFHSSSSGITADRRILFLHGFTGDITDWQPIMELLGGSADMLAVDLPGHGRTNCADDDFSMHNTAENLRRFLQSSGFLPCHLVAYSMGGRLGLYMLLHYPESFLDSVLESASPGLKTEVERGARKNSDDARASELELSSLTHFLTKWYEQPLFETMKRRTDAFNSLMRRRLTADKSGWIKSLRYMGTGQQPSLWEKLPELTHSVRLIVGQKDGKFKAIGEQMTAVNSRFELIQIADAGHNVHFEQPEAFAAEIRDFFDLEG